MENESERRKKFFFHEKKGFADWLSFIGFCVLTTFYGLNGESIGFERDFNFIFFVRPINFLFKHFKRKEKTKKWKLEKKNVHKKGQLRIIDSASFFFYPWITWKHFVGIFFRLNVENEIKRDSLFTLSRHFREDFYLLFKSIY